MHMVLLAEKKLINYIHIKTNAILLMDLLH